MEVLVVGSVPEIYSLENIFSCMSVDKINNNFDTSTMSLVNELFKLIRFSKFAGNAKEIADMITKWAIVRMFENGHDLNNIVAAFRHYG